MFKVLVTTLVFAGDQQGGAAVDTVVLEFTNPQDADFAARRINDSSRNTLSYDQYATPLYRA